MEASISVNIFFGDAGESNFIEKLISNKLEAFSFWLLNIIEQNRPLVTFPLMLSELGFTIERFLTQQFKEYATEAQTQVLVKIVMEYLQLKELPPPPPIKDSSDRVNPPRLKIRGLLWRD